MSDVLSHLSHLSHLNAILMGQTDEMEVES